MDQGNKLSGIIDITVLLHADDDVDIQKIMHPAGTFLFASTLASVIAALIPIISY